MIDYKLWKENIYNSIEDISDIERQKIIWLGKSNDFASSFTEDVNMLYDSFCFADDFWEEEHLLKFNFSNELLKQLRTLKDLIDGYNEKPTDEEILKDPEWHKITEQAKKIISIWK